MPQRTHIGRRCALYKHLHNRVSGTRWISRKTTVTTSQSTGRVSSSGVRPARIPSRRNLRLIRFGRQIFIRLFHPHPAHPAAIHLHHTKQSPFMLDLFARRRNMAQFA